jgi:hypothetical protein
VAGGCCATTAGNLCLALGPDGNGADAETASLVYTVTHDLRAPIRVVEGFTRIIKEDYGRQLDRVGNDHLDRVLAAGARMNLMIDAVLTMARLATQPLTRQPVDLSQLAAFVVDDLRRAAPERVVDVQIEAGLRARGDPTLMRLVLENLLGNAWKYSGRNPQARIEFGAAPTTHRRRPAGPACSRCATTVPASTCAWPTACSACSSACTVRRTFRAPASGWPRCGASCSATAARSGPNRNPAAAPRSSSPWRTRRRRRASVQAAAGQFLDRLHQPLGLLLDRQALVLSQPLHTLPGPVARQ